MQLHSFRGSVLVILFWISGRGVCLLPQYVSLPQYKQFNVYKQCIKNHSVLTWKLLGPAYNGSFYTVLNFRFNQLIEKAFPIAIITPTESRDVQAAVRCGVKTSIPLVPISGGHSYIGLSYGTNDSIVIDFLYMNGISINLKKKTAAVESGTLMSQLYGALWKKGKLGAAMGICATVGMGGLALGGGIGYFSSLYGLVIDNLLEINMVDARGNAVLVNPKHNADLWWALRGIGPGYIGIVTSIKIKVFSTDDLELTYLRLRYDNRSFKAVMTSYIRWLDWAKIHEPSISSVITIISDKYANPYEPLWPGIEVQLLQVKDPRIKWTGNPAFVDAAQQIFPKTDNTPIVSYPTFASFVVENNHTVKYNKMEKWIPDTVKSRFDYLSSKSKYKADVGFYYSKSFYVKGRYNAEDLTRTQEILLEIPNDSCGVWINSEQGAISMHWSNDSSYVHRDALFNFKVYHSGDNIDHVKPAQKWIRKLYNSVRFLDSGETYQNYPERNINHLRRYYGSNLERLIEIKRKWDPDGYFNTTQSIPIR